MKRKRYNVTSQELVQGNFRRRSHSGIDDGYVQTIECIVEDQHWGKEGVVLVVHVLTNVTPNWTVYRLFTPPNH